MSIIERENYDLTLLISDQTDELRIVSSTSVAEETSKSTSTTVHVPTFGSPEPTLYQLGDVIQMVIVNDFAAYYGICSAGVAENLGNDSVFLTNIVSDLQISGPSGASPLAGAHESVFTNERFIQIPNDAHPRMTYLTSIDDIQGGMVGFTFAAKASVRAETPFGTTGNEFINYATTAVVESGLTRTTVYDEYILVKVPEPSGAVLLIGACTLMAFRRRRL